MTRNMTISSVLCSALVLACVDRRLVGDATGDSSTGDGGGEASGVPTSSGQTGTPPPPTDTGSEPQPGTDTTSSTGSETTAMGTTCGFICATTEPSVGQCDVFAQDCPEGEKCAPYAEGGNSSWNATKCVPVTGDGKPGEPCMTMGGGVSGLDDCAKGGMCWDVDAENQGTCHELCFGSLDDPKCTDEVNFYCGVGEVLSLCFPKCDPLIQDCANDELCIPIGDRFVCVLDASGDAGAVFDACEFANACDKGLLCLNPTAAGECDPKAGGCCMPFCDLSKPNVMCPGVGTVCQSLYAEGMAPPQYENIGICAVSL